MSDTETMIKVMSAYVDGDMIECRNKMFGGDWTPITKTVPLWNWPLYDYRIKPEDAEHVNIGTDKRLWALEQQVNNLQLALREVRLNQNSKWTGTMLKKPEEVMIETWVYKQTGGVRFCISGSRASKELEADAKDFYLLTIKSSNV